MKKTVRNKTITIWEHGNYLGESVYFFIAFVTIGVYITYSLKSQPELNLTTERWQPVRRYSKAFQFSPRYHSFLDMHVSGKNNLSGNLAPIDLNIPHFSL